MKPLRIAITTGDVDGIGTEVAAKALAKLKPKTGISFIFWRSPKCPKSHLKILDRYFHRHTVHSWPEALSLKSDSAKFLIDINSSLNPPTWVETSAQAGMYKHIDALVTAPISKTEIIRSGFKDLGHTGILKRVSQQKELFMAFIGSKFSVVLATGHVPLAEISHNLTSSRLRNAVLAAEKLRALMNVRSNKPIGILGLNPHSGESGLIGFDEQNLHLPLIQLLKKEGYKVEGPLVPDAAFLESIISQHSVLVANYHDQGLIPFKMVHGQKSGIQITMGLPFIRTSVDHGTAKTLFGRNKADYNSMVLAIEWAIRLSKKSTDLTL